jgi:hypothetical protein
VRSEGPSTQDYPRGLADHLRQAGGSARALGVVRLRSTATTSALGSARHPPTPQLEKVIAGDPGREVVLHIIRKASPCRGCIINVRLSGGRQWPRRVVSHVFRPE